MKVADTKYAGMFRQIRSDNATSDSDYVALLHSHSSCYLPEVYLSISNTPDHYAPTRRKRKERIRTGEKSRERSKEKGNRRCREGACLFLV